MKKLLFTLFLSLVFATSWADCISSNLQPTELKISKREATYPYTFNNNRSVKVVSFDAKRDATGIGKLYLEQQVGGSWETIWEANPGKVTSTILGIESKVDYEHYTVSINTNATAIRFSTNDILSYSKYLKNVILTYAPVLNIASGDINFGSIEEGSVIPNKSITIDYAAIEQNLTVQLVNQDNVFSTSLTGTSTTPVTVAKADCSFGKATINVSFSPTALGVYTNQISFSNGTTINVSGEYSRRINTQLRVVSEKYTSVNLAWDKVDDATAYLIINNTTGASYLVDAAATTYYVSGLSMATTYNFTLYAIFNGAKSINGSSTNATTKTVDADLEDCVVFEDDTEKSYLVDIFTERYIVYDMPSDVSYYTKRLEFEVKASDNAYIDKDGDMGIYVLLNGANTYQKLDTWSGKSAGINNSYKKCVVDIPYNTISIKFTNSTWNGSLMRYVKKVKVFKDNVLESNFTSLNFGAVAIGESVTKEINLTYANAAMLKAGIDSDQFSLAGFEATEACEEGVQTVKITFTPTDCKNDYTASLSVFNGQDISITLQGTLKTPLDSVYAIIWNGNVSTEWDNRDNWYKQDNTPLLCSDILSTQLTVTLPAGLERYPVLPDVSSDEKFGKQRHEQWNGKQVNAGDNATATQIAYKIILEHGASIVGVETLYNPSTGVRRYHEVEKQFEANRKEWLLVGTVVKPWDESGNGEVRNILSKDYFLGHLPQVYMHEAVIDQDNNATWQQSFIDLDKEVPQNKAFAIYVANEYGASYYPAETFDYYNGTAYAATLAHPHRYTFTGHFYNESSVITYDNLTPNQPVLLCNTYPAAIDANALNKAGYGTIQYYDYTTSKSFATAKEGAVILPQNGFVFTPGDGVTSLTIGAEYMITGGTTSRSTIATPTSCRIKANNAARSVSSEISIQYDQEKEDVTDFSIDAPKLFAKETYGLPDVYVIRHDANWADITIPDMTEPIPLGVTINSSKQTFTLEMTQNNMPYTWVLEDRTTSTMYNLSNGEVCTVSGLKKGDYKGRFYLHATPTQQEDSDVTAVEDVPAQNNNIDIFVQENTVIVSASEEAQLQRIVVSDMVGRSTTYTVNDQYAEISLPNSKGIYIINVVGEAGIATKKVRL